MAAYPPIEDWVSLRYRPGVERFHGCGPTASFDLFDWVIWYPMANEFSRTAIEQPRSILCLTTPESVGFLLQKANFSSKPHIVFAGEDTNLSACVQYIEQIADRFSKIYFEAKDIESERIRSFSMGFISYYLRDARPDNIYRAIERSDSEAKSKLALAAWGQRWKFLDDRIEDRWLLDQALESHPFLERTFVAFDGYWQELADYEFIVAPRGNGVQAPKLAEAWMVRTVPICTSNPTFRDLQALGYPMVLIDDWSELTAENFETWRKTREAVDWDNIRFMCTNAYLQNLLAD